MFRQMDLDGDGFISVGEYTAALRRAGVKDANESMAEHVVQQYDTSKVYDSIALTRRHVFVQLFLLTTPCPLF